LLFKFIHFFIYLSCPRLWKREENSIPPTISDTLLPEGIETAPKRFAITYRNKWMIEQSDFVVTYVVHDAASGAAQFKKLAERRGKTVMELSSTKSE
jgi:hypothetical protein